MTNFDFLKNTPDFDVFSDVAVSVEKILHIDVDYCVLNCAGRWVCGQMDAFC